MKADINNIRISGIYGGIPKNISRYEDELDNYTHSPASSLKLKKVMGYNEHRVVSSNAAITDLIYPVIERMVENEHLDIREVDAIVLVTQTPDYHIPSTSSLIHGYFGFSDDCYCIDINDGCAGFIKGLYESSSIMKNSDVKKVLLITGDVLSRKVSKSDRNSYPLIGDAITVTMIDESHYENSQPLELKFDGQGALALNIPAGGMKNFVDGDSAQLREDEEGNIRSLEHLVMQGRDVFTFTQTVVVDFLQTFIHKNSDVDVDMAFLHQANLFILDRIRKKLGFNESSLPSSVIQKYGNSSSATIPMAIIDSYKDNDNTFSDNVLLAGFGVGLSWGAALLKFDGFKFINLIEIEV